MADETSPRTFASTLRGWLSDVLYPTLLAGPLPPLVTRLGAHSSIDHPLFGRASGVAGLEALLGQAHGWLTARAASYAPRALLIGTDRDVAEGTLTLTPTQPTQTDGETEREDTTVRPPLVLPVAIVAERRRSREVRLRVYHATHALLPAALHRELPTRPKDAPNPPLLVAAHLDAIRKGDANAAVACFESDGLVRDADGNDHHRSDEGLLAYSVERFGLGEGGPRFDVTPVGYADDGRACAIELTLSRKHPDEAAAHPHPLLAVYERGPSGLFRALRLYEEPLDPASSLP